MTEIVNTYAAGLEIFLGGMPEDVIALAATGLALAVGVFFAALPILLIRKGVRK